MTSPFRKARVTVALARRVRSRRLSCEKRGTPARGSSRLMPSTSWCETARILTAAIGPPTGVRQEKRSKEQGAGASERASLRPAEPDHAVPFEADDPFLGHRVLQVGQGLAQGGPL